MSVLMGRSGTDRRRRGVIATAAAFALGGLLAGCSFSLPGQRSSTAAKPPAPSTSAPADDPAARPQLARFYGQKPTWTDCGGGFRCTSVTVPVDWAQPEGATISLAVIRRPATGSRIGSLFINPGGPGVSGVDFLREGSRVFSSTLGTAYDLVSWDPRGIGKSSPVECIPNAEIDAYLATDSTPDTPAEQTALVDVTRRFDAGCEQRTGPILAHVDTLSTVKDMDVLRAVVGDHTLTYYGGSYGTFLGAWYAQTFPWRVGRLVLDGAADPETDTAGYAAGQALGFARGLQAYVNDCLSSQDCPLRGNADQAKAQLTTLIDSADSRPLRTEDGRPLTQSLLLTGIIQGMYTRLLWPTLNQALTKALQGDGSGLLALADEYNQRDAAGVYQQTMQATSAIYCLDHPETRTVTQIAADAQDLERRYPPLGASIGWGSLSCVGWPAKPVLHPQKLTAEGAAPILVVGSTGDPATPYEWAQALASQLSSGRLLTREGFGHTAYFQGSRCTDTAIDQYLLAGVLPERGTVCN
jgi:pimeloyl-ACP methyl ester carboxylesterase